MQYLSQSDELSLKEIRALLIRTGNVNLKPEVAILRLLKGHFNDWATLLNLREDIIAESGVL